MSGDEVVSSFVRPCCCLLTSPSIAWKLVPDPESETKPLLARLNTIIVFKALFVKMTALWLPIKRIFTSLGLSNDKTTFSHVLCVQLCDVPAIQATLYVIILWKTTAGIGVL